MKKVCVLLALGLLPSTALAQKSNESPARDRNTPVTKVEFTGTELTGTVYGPDGVVLKTRHKATFKSLLRVRENFRPELLQSAAAL